LSFVSDAQVRDKTKMKVGLWNSLFNKYFFISGESLWPPRGGYAASDILYQEIEETDGLLKGNL
jgi:hypothetical protein